ncbi:hypothetical protein FRC06_010287 [Ceratobasidium sp. 370]|nr:hypothetical protein FRC06_010287 [Ceratobasidium sp. 370]
MPELLELFSGSSNTNYAKEENNNAGIQNYGPARPNVTWEHCQKVAPVIPYYLYNIQYVEEQIPGQSWSHIHKAPKYEKDIEALIHSHNATEIHIEVPDHVVNRNDIKKDCFTAGTCHLKTRKITDSRVH